MLLEIGLLKRKKTKTKTKQKTKQKQNKTKASSYFYNKIIIIMIKSFLMVEPCLIWNRLLSQLQFEDLQAKLAGQSIELFSYMAS